MSRPSYAPRTFFTCPYDGEWLEWIGRDDVEKPWRFKCPLCGRIFYDLHGELVESPERT